MASWLSHIGDVAVELGGQPTQPAAIASQAAGVAEFDRVTSSGCPLELCRESGDDGQRAKSALGQAAGLAAAGASGFADDRRERRFQRARPRRGARRGAANAETTGRAAGRSVDGARSDKAAEIAAVAEPATVTGVARPDPLKGTKGALLARAACCRPSEADGLRAAADGGPLHLVRGPRAGRSDGGGPLAGSAVATLGSAGSAQAVAAQNPETGGAPAAAAPPRPIAMRPTGRLREAVRGHLGAGAERASARGPRGHLNLEGRYFAGKGGCGRSAEFAGFPAQYFDLVSGAKSDVLRPKVMNGLIVDMQGHAPDGANWTCIAQACLDSLCRALVQILFAFIRVAMDISGIIVGVGRKGAAWQRRAHRPQEFRRAIEERELPEAAVGQEWEADGAPRYHAPQLGADAVRDLQAWPRALRETTTHEQLHRTAMVKHPLRAMTEDDRNKSQLKENPRRRFLLGVDIQGRGSEEGASLDHPTFGRPSRVLLWAHVCPLGLSGNLDSGADARAADAAIAGRR
ncbi:unnamed protein product [Prorocentrum cordatum]|uniref:Uncharacterized protein n=1 Tax=Prorocentrum cordatum TaxID=2364126 RepID=A0ABN9W748_9DINO|nr:unnamed protein product [Polarella glacialis]